MTVRFSPAILPLTVHAETRKTRVAPASRRCDSGVWGCALLLAVLAAVALAGSAGCVRRTVTINSDPQGATVTLNDQEVGTTPASVEFTWYGDYDVILRKEGYRTLRTHQRLNSPWYQVPPIDFVAEILLPFTIHDRQQAFFALEPQQPMAREDLVKAAVEFRERTLFGEE